MNRFKVFSLCALTTLIGLAGCDSSPGSESVPGGQHDPSDPFAQTPVEPGAPVTTKLPDAEQQEFDALQQQLDAVQTLTPDEFQSKYSVPFSSLGYDASVALGIDTIQASALALNGQELDLVKQNGFAISERQRFPSFVYGYQTLYMQDLPLYVSADSVLNAVHRSYDSILESLESQALIPTLDHLLSTMRGRLQGGAGSNMSARAQSDADLYLAVAHSLLTGSIVPSVAGANPSKVSELVQGANDASGLAQLELFGAKRDVDFSQFKPRGHYTHSDELKRYFRAMIWLGRIDLRILETQPDHSQLLHRRQLEAAYLLHELMDAGALQEWKQIDDVIGAFVGEADNMTPEELGGLLSDLDIATPQELASKTDAEIAQAVVNGGYGTQRISSHIMINGLGEGTMPLSSTFLLFGQRYVVDSHVFSNVVYDRVQKGSVYRMMPNPLDAAFAALGNNQAGLLLAPEITEYKYAPDLASMRILVDAHPADYWEENLYNLWLGSLRTLSPDVAAVANPAAVGLPRVASTEAWGRRLLNTQLASWAELRHDTILYAKQSYTGGASCEFPDAYVEPYPEFFATLERFAERGQLAVAGLDLSKVPYLETRIQGYFTSLKSVAGTLREMAANQRTGAPHSQAHLDFINQAVRIQDGCGEPAGVDGWYAQLFFNPVEGVEFDPTIADVHTQPTDEAGNFVGKVLHAGTGNVRLMIVTADTCSGPRAYAGLASSYFEKVTENFERLDDEEWSAELSQATPADVPWMTPIVAR